VLGLPYHDHIQLPQCLHLIPSLARFKLWTANPQIVIDLFAALADIPSLLANLHTPAIRFMTSSLRASFCDSPIVSDSSWRTLLRVLSTRRLALHIFPATESLPLDVIAAFRELAAGGLQIHIGDENNNLIDTASEEEI
jgi:hypothetical protein